MSCEEPLNPGALAILSVGVCRLSIMTGSPSLVAFVDETARNDPQHGQFYALAAVVMDKANPGYGLLWRDIHWVAHAQPSGMIHASDMARSHDGAMNLVSVERSIGDNSAVLAIAVVHSPFGSGGEEEARQHCLADLMVALFSGFEVRHVTIDSRDPLGVATKSMTAKRGTRNYEDLVTIRDLQTTGELPKDLKVFHANDRFVHQLWVADVAAYAIGRSLTDRDPGRLQWLAPHLQMKEAHLLPVSRRSDGHLLTPETGLTSMLKAYIAQANAIRQFHYHEPVDVS